MQNKFDNSIDFKTNQANAIDPKQDVDHHRECKRCNAKICNNRYVCITCDNYDLCSKCQHEGAHRHHVMLRLVDSDFMENHDQCNKHISVEYTDE